MSETQQAQGTIWAVFGHRLAVDGAAGRVLADLGPEGVKELATKGLSLTAGDAIHVEGTRKPSEIKVDRLTLADGTSHAIAWNKPHDESEPAADPEGVREALRRAGYHMVGEPKRKPKHFEVRADRDGGAFEVHMALDGTIRKAKTLDMGI